MTKNNINIKLHKNSKAAATLLVAAVAISVFIVFCISLFVGQFKISISDLIDNKPMATNVFFRLRIPRVIMALFAGFGIGICGLVYQIVFRNPLAAPDIIGVSSGASMGAAFAILFVSSSALATTFCAFAGGLLAVLLCLALASLAPGNKGNTIILSGIAVQALAQTVLMILKLMADPERELASIEYWIMGSLNGILQDKLYFPIIIITAGSILLFILHRQTIILSLAEEEAALLGVPVKAMRLIILLVATFIVGSIICVTGLISFVGLLAPHIARGLTKRANSLTLLLSGLIGSLLLLLSDIFARTTANSELPVSIFTSILGAPFLIYLLLKRSK